MHFGERNHASLRVHGSARAFPSIETFFSFLIWVLAQRAISTPMPFGVSKRILQSLCKRFRGNLSLPKWWDNFAPSQSQTLLQAKRELDFKSNPRFTSSGNGGSLKAKRRHRLGDENPLEVPQFLGRKISRPPVNKGRSDDFRFAASENPAAGTCRRFRSWW